MFFNTATSTSKKYPIRKYKQSWKMFENLKVFDRLSLKKSFFKVVFTAKDVK
jgi:hypothetical protein